MKYLILFLAVSSVSFAQQHYLHIFFSEKMDSASIRQANNFTIFDDSLNIIPISQLLIAQGDSIVILKIGALSYKTNFLIRVQNVKDVAGNLIDPEHDSAWFYFDGFDPNQDISNLSIKKK